jgi:predicted phage terminase large subunit-like protein
MAEDLRQFMRQQATDSLYFCCKVVFGYRDMTAQLHKDVCNFLQYGQSRHKLLVLPRGHLKSHIATIGYPTWLTIRNPNMRTLLVNESATNAQHFLRKIISFYKENEMFRWLFPEIIPDFKTTKCTATEFEIKRTEFHPEATFEAMGVESTATSRHYDLIVEDDLVGDDQILTPEQMQKVVDWHKYSVSLSVNPATYQNIVVGTRWAFNDLISWVIENEPHYDKFFRSVTIDPETGKPAYPGTPIWPERFTEEVVQQILYKQGPRIFSCQYMNDPVHEDQRSFNRDWFRYFDKIPPVPLRYFMAVDPALSQGIRGDFTGICVIGVDPDFNIYIMDAKHGRWGVDEMIDQIFDTYVTWKPAGVGLETIMFQRVLMWPIREAMRRSGITFSIRELRPSSRITKEGRISALHEPFANGTFWIRSDLKDLVKELTEFPFGAHDDIIDALAHVYQMARPADQVEARVLGPFNIDAILAEAEEAYRRSQTKPTWMRRGEYNAEGAVWSKRFQSGEERIGGGTFPRS